MIQTLPIGRDVTINPGKQLHVFHQVHVLDNTRLIDEITVNDLHFSEQQGF